MFENKSINFVEVQFESRYKPGTYNGKPYTYIADVALDVGDIVKVPTRSGESTARVCRINVPITDIQCKVGELRHITEPPTVTGGMFDGFF